VCGFGNAAKFRVDGNCSDNGAGTMKPDSTLNGVDDNLGRNV
jgi:hypothetical protein